jgi:hypothetical protein
MAQWGNVDNAANSVNWAVSQVNKSITTANTEELFGNTTADVYFTGATVGQFGVDTTEAAAANGMSHAGWVIRTEGSGGRAGRVHYETLVAMGSMTGDAEDTAFPDYRIVISSQPQDSEEADGAPASFTVVAASVPAGATLSYQWQVDGGPGSQTFANVANTGVYQSANGNTSATLSISDNSTLEDNVYRVLVYVDGGYTVTSANATLTYSA